VLISAATAFAAPLQHVTVFQQGEGGYHTFRIPAIVAANDGTLLAFAEGRVNGSGDNGNIDLVLKRSFDGGATWGPLQLIHNNGSSEAGNPAPVVDRNTGHIIIPFVNDRSNPVLKVSADNGATWGALVNLGASAKMPTWNGYAFGPVHAIQLERGPHAGRLVVSGNHTLLGQSLNPAGREAHLIYSDDGGATWQVGGVLKNPNGGINPNESTIVELVDGRVHINTRNQAGAYQRRLIGFSTDSGETFTGLAQVEHQLIDPTIQAALLRYAAADTGDGHNRILFSNTDSETTRHRMTIKSSFDETATWDAGKLVYRGPSGYSDLVKTATGGGILYENGTSAYFNRITFARFDTAWLDNPALQQIDFRASTVGSTIAANATILDREGNGVHGTLIGNGVTVVGGDPRYANTGAGGGKAIRLDGQNDYLRFTDISQHLMDFEAGDSFTLEAVFKTTAHATGGTAGSGPLIAKDVGANSPSYWLRIQDGRLRFLIDDGTQTANVFSPINLPISDGQWHHVAAVRDAASNELRLFVDYQLVATAADTTTGGFGNANNLIVGAFNASSPGDRRFNGDLHLTRIAMQALDLYGILAPRLTGDANNDGVVDDADILAVETYLGNAGEDHGLLLGDANDDGRVDGADLLTVERYFGSTIANPLVPEPAAAAVLLSGLALLTVRRVA